MLLRLWYVVIVYGRQDRLPHSLSHVTNTYKAIGLRALRTRIIWLHDPFCDAFLITCSNRIAPNFAGLQRFPEGHRFNQWMGDDFKALISWRRVPIFHIICELTLQYLGLCTVRCSRWQESNRTDFFINCWSYSSRGSFTRILDQRPWGLRRTSGKCDFTIFGFISK